LSGGPGLVCPSCGQAVFADDQFCEGCGSAIAEPRDRARDRDEFDGGRVGGVTDRGLVHERNDDAMYARVDEHEGGRRTVAVVCDGVSTSAAPEVAAQLAAEVIGEMLVAGSSAENAFAAADEQVRELPWTTVPGRTGPSCTAVAAVVGDGEIRLAWAGDSRAYWVTVDAVRVLTVDHSWAQEQIDAGAMTPAEAAADRRAHMITRWLGECGLDHGVAQATVPVDSSGRLVLCSDGLWAHLSMDDLREMHLALQESGALGLARSLVALALARGGSDNTTVVVVDVDGPRPAPFSPSPTAPPSTHEVTA
jgi:serine/threonine protein phosphatase PrpC